MSVSIKPLEDRIVIQQVEAEQTTASGLVIPDTAKEKPQEGEVLAVGPGRIDDNGASRWTWRSVTRSSTASTAAPRSSSAPTSTSCSRPATCSRSSSADDAPEGPTAPAVGPSSCPQQSAGMRLQWAVHGICRAPGGARGRLG